jgi:hypothetical protein
MQVLSAALAFAIIMLVLSMVVSTLVETIHRLLGMRERGLYRLLGQFYDQVLKPYASVPATDPPAVPVPSDTRQQAGPILGISEPQTVQNDEEIQRRHREAEDAARTAFQGRMSENRTPVGVVVPSAGPARTSYPAFDWSPHWPASWSEVPRWVGGLVTSLGRWVNVNRRGRGLSSLSCVGLMERLGGHPLSDAIVGRVRGAAAAVAAASTGPEADPSPAPDATTRDAKVVPDPVDATLQDIAQKFEAYANEASVFFERRARTLSIAVAFVVAYALHVNAVDIFKTFLRDPAVAEGVIARKDELTKTFDPARADGEKRIPPVAANGAELRLFQQAVKDIDALKKEYTDAIDRFKTAETQLGGLGVPIGWTEERKRVAAFWPGWKWQTCEKAGEQPRYLKAGEKCGTGEKLAMSIGFGIPTDLSVLLGLLLGGLLVGLGGPFWYDMVNSLTSIRNIARGQATPAQTTPAGAAPGAGGAKETPQPRTPVDAFKAARAGWIAAGRP